jgi:hypothetical protein
MSDMDEASRLAAQLAASTEAVQDAFHGLDAAALSRRPGQEEWAAWDVAYHVAQIEVWYIAKLCEAASDGPAEALVRFMALWTAMRAQALALAAAIPAERLDVPGLLTSVPDWTPRELVERIAGHDLEHVAQVRAAVSLDSASGAGDDGRGA